MVGLKLSTKDLDEIIKILGIEDDAQGKVYLSLLSLGNGTLGQISILTGLDYIQTQEALKVLIGSKFVKRIPGVVGRYIALEPFLKSFFLGYDPITLVNIRKESATMLKNNLNKITDDFDKTTQVFQENAQDLENDFLESLSPVSENFNDLINNTKRIVEYSKTHSSINIQEFQTNINDALLYLDKLIYDIKTDSENNIDQIPAIFRNSSKEIDLQLSKIKQDITEIISDFRGKNLNILDLFKRDYSEFITSQVNSLDEVMHTFNTNRNAEIHSFTAKKNNLSHSIEQLRQKTQEKKNNFEKLKIGYNQVNSSFLSLFPEVDKILKEMGTLINESISDISSRKLFKGKEEFLSKLDELENRRKSLLDLNTRNVPILDKITQLEGVLAETEKEVVDASENGFDQTKILLESISNTFTGSIEELKDKIEDEIKNSTKASLMSNEEKIHSQINLTNEKIKTLFESVNNEIFKINNDFYTNLVNLTQKIAQDFKNQLNNFYNESVSNFRSKNNITSIKRNMDELIALIFSESSLAFTQIDNLNEAFETYVSGLNAFTSSFANTLHDAFYSTLTESREIIDNQVMEFDVLLEQEISALIFTIKEMKQKLSKIFELSRVLETSDFDSSIINSDLVIGESSIIMLLRDLTLRAKSSLTILMPRPELQTLIAASKLPMKTRVNIIGDFKKVPASTLKKVLTANNIRLKQLDGIEFWGCIRDAEELLICPEPKDPEKEELVGVISANENLVELFSQELITYTTRSKEILPQDLE